MKKTRWLGIPIKNGVILKSPETGITAKVVKPEDGTEMAGLIGYREESEIFKKEKIAKKGIILCVTVIYMAVITSFYLASGLVGIVAGVYLTATSGRKIIYLMVNGIYSFKYKQHVQYLNILKTMERLYKENIDINYENISSISYVSNRKNIEKIRNSIFDFLISITILFIKENNFIIPITMQVCVFIIYIMTQKSEKAKKIFLFFEKSLFYRKPTKEQIELVLFGWKFLKN